MKIERLSAPLGARVSGVDVREVGEHEFGLLDELFCEHKVLVFPHQELTPEDHKKFAQFWGELVSHPYAAMEDFPEIIELKNSGKKRDVNQHWHTDMSYNETPPKLTMLYAHEVPAMGGDTAFSNQELAYDENGQPLATTFMDYLLPTSTDVPTVESLELDLAPSPLNPLGVKGGGEGGIVASGAVLANAVSHALAPLGVEVRELPLSLNRVRELVRQRQGRA